MATSVKSKLQLKGPEILRDDFRVPAISSKSSLPLWLCNPIYKGYWYTAKTIIISASFNIC